MAETKSVIGKETLLENIGKEDFLKVLKRKGKQMEDVYSEDEVKKASSFLILNVRVSTGQGFLAFK